MLHPELKVMGKKLSSKEALENVFSLKWFMCNIGPFWLQVEYSENRSAFIGWSDDESEEIFYFDNGSKNTKSVDLLINICPEERMMCYEDKMIRDIVYYFCETGKRNLKYNWMEDKR